MQNPARHLVKRNGLNHDAVITIYLEPQTKLAETSFSGKKRPQPNSVAMQVRVEILQFRVPAPKFIAPKNAELRRFDPPVLTYQTQRHPARRD